MAKGGATIDLIKILKPMTIDKLEISFQDWFEDTASFGNGVTYNFRLTINGVDLSGREKVNFYSGDMVNDFDNINKVFANARETILIDKLKNGLK